MASATFPIRRGTPNATDGGRAALEEGLAASTGLMAVVAVVFASVVVAFLGPARALSDPAAWAHVGTALFLGAVSAVVRRRRGDVGRLRTLDALATLGSGLGFSLLTVGRAPTSARELVLLLFMAHALIVRAALVPSSPRRTLALSALALLPSLVQALVVKPRLHDPLGSTFAFASLTLLWVSTTVLASVIVSRRTYGLSRRVEEVRRLGPYALERKIGEGGMGEVFKARHALLRRATAVKIIRGEQTPADRARFEREVQLTSRLTHQNTVQVYDFGCAPDGTPYYAMEYIDGLTLAQLVSTDGPQPPGRVVSLLLQICASLAEAHALGLIHGDVKPENVLVCRRGLEPDMVKVVDFGLARRVQRRSAENRPEDAPVAGTAAYMAPEAVIAPATVDARSDIYSLGALAFFLLTGTDLFHGATHAVLMQQVHAVPQRPSSRVGRELPADLERIVMRCLAKDPALRPASVRDLARELASARIPADWSRAAAEAFWDRNGAAIASGVYARARTGATVEGSAARAATTTTGRIFDRAL